ncbi:MAG: prepilin-type N-terminal cleavage/methylation domain-containing protein [Acidobacteria bacterium]|nr:prepilin-type N-terminal cleavage/methylation domain-containing protein [Acidobacteriota bacterium]
MSLLHDEADIGADMDKGHKIMTGKRDQGFTLIELLIVVAIISIIAAIAVPNLLRARMSANETSALASLKVVNSSEVAYSASCGNNGYAISFVTLATPAPTMGFISADLGVAAPIKSGYNFVLAAGAGAMPGPADCNAVETQTGYYASARPTGYGTTGSKSYATNAANTVYQQWADISIAEPFGLPAIPIG